MRFLSRIRICRIRSHCWCRLAMATRGLTPRGLLRCMAAPGTLLAVGALLLAFTKGRIQGAISCSARPQLLHLLQFEVEYLLRSACFPTN